MIVGEFFQRYHEEPPRQGMDNDLLTAADSQPAKGGDKKPLPDVVPVAAIACRQRFGGVLKHYYRQAA
ncbi:MAG: hypothetical protein R3C10_23330 [Pirellulales bacterium]